MRLAIEEDVQAPFYEVFLDGRQLECCVLADDEVGYAVVAEEAPADQAPLLRILRGKVELRRVNASGK